MHKFKMVSLHLLPSHITKLNKAIKNNTDVSLSLTAPHNIHSDSQKVKVPLTKEQHETIKKRFAQSGNKKVRVVLTADALQHALKSKTGGGFWKKLFNVVRKKTGDLAGFVGRKLASTAGVAVGSVASEIPVLGQFLAPVVRDKTENLGRDLSDLVADKIRGAGMMDTLKHLIHRIYHNKANRGAKLFNESDFKTGGLLGKDLLNIFMTLYNRGRGHGECKCLTDADLKKGGLMGDLINIFNHLVNRGKGTSGGAISEKELIEGGFFGDVMNIFNTLYNAGKKSKKGGFMRRLPSQTDIPNVDPPITWGRLRSSRLKTGNGWNDILKHYEPRGPIGIIPDPNSRRKTKKGDGFANLFNKLADATAKHFPNFGRGIYPAGERRGFGIYPAGHRV
jgi:hypothetical protein